MVNGVPRHMSQCLSNLSKSVFGPLRSVFRDLSLFFGEFEVLGISLGFLKCEIGLAVKQISKNLTVSKNLKKLGGGGGQTMLIRFFVVVFLSMFKGSLTFLMHI